MNLESKRFNDPSQVLEVYSSVERIHWDVKKLLETFVFVFGHLINKPVSSW